MAARENAMFANHPDGALREDLPAGRPMADQYVDPFEVSDIPGK